MRTTALLQADTYCDVDYTLPIVAARATMGPKLFVLAWLQSGRLAMALMSQGSQLASSPSY